MKTGSLLFKSSANHVSDWEWGHRNAPFTFEVSTGVYSFGLCQPRIGVWRNRSTRWGGCCVTYLDSMKANGASAPQNTHEGRRANPPGQLVGPVDASFFELYTPSTPLTHLISTQLDSPRDRDLSLSRRRYQCVPPIFEAAHQPMDLVGARRHQCLDIQSRAAWSGGRTTSLSSGARLHNKITEFVRRVSQRRRTPLGPFPSCPGSAWRQPRRTPRGALPTLLRPRSPQGIALLK